MAKQPKGELVVVGFNYDLLEAKIAEHARSSAQQIRDRVKRTIEDIIEVGNDLLAVREALPHGQFGPWLVAEFGWTERTARNFMAVAERFGPKTEMISDLTIQPTAAYLLAETRKKSRPRRQKTIPTEKLGVRLVKALERYRERWPPKELSELARSLREFADSLEKPHHGGKKTRKG